MMRRSLGLAGLAMILGLAATPAQACRYGGSDLIFSERPSPPDGPRYSTLALVILSAEAPGPDLSLGAAHPRGFPVGEARVLDRLSGPMLRATVPAYLSVMTSCSNFFRGPRRTFVKEGYVVGRLAHDDHGAYLLLAERHDSGGWD